MNLKLALIAGGALFATPAFADDQSEPAAGGTTEAAPATDPAAGGGMGTTTGTTAPVWGWSRSVIDRPYILGKGKIAAYGQYATTTVTVPDPVNAGMTLSLTADNFQVGGGYGVTDKITAGAQYSLTPGLIGDVDGEVQGTFDIYGEYEIIRDAKLNVTASADLPINFCSRDAMGNCGVGLGLNAGLGARYIVAPKMAVFTGKAYGPGPVGQHLSISFESGGPIDFALPVGFMYQATPELNVQLTTTLLNIGISNSNSTFIFADYIPVTLGALYSINPNIDVVGMFGFQDLKNDASAFGFAIGARWYN